MLQHRRGLLHHGAGVFQNSILLTGLINVSEKKNFSVFSHQQVPTNDGGIALGQAVVAAATATGSVPR